MWRILMVGLLFGGQVRAQTLDSTVLLDEPLLPGVSWVWSAAGQLGWDRLCAFHRVESIELEPLSASGAALNAFEWDPARVLPEGAFALAGEYTMAFAEKVREELTKRVGPQAAAMIGDPSPLGPVEGEEGTSRLYSGLIVAGLTARPQFPVAFTAEADARVFRNRQDQPFMAKGFGARGARAGLMPKSVRVLADGLDGTFIVALPLMDANQGAAGQMILLREDGLRSMEEGFERIRAAREAPLPEVSVAEDGDGKAWRYEADLTAVDEFWMPDLSLSLLADYPDLTGREYLRSSPTPETQARWRLAEVQQWLSLRLNHEGVLAEAVFKIPPDFLVGSGRPPSEVDPETLELWPKRLVLDRSFLFTLWQPGAEWPYFAVWVDGGDVLVRR